LLANSRLCFVVFFGRVEGVVVATVKLLDGRASVVVAITGVRYAVGVYGVVDVKNVDFDENPTFRDPPQPPQDDIFEMSSFSIRA
jgi:hypothetical protein